MVSIFEPTASKASIRQLLTARPSTSTVQAPHSPLPQPSLAPVKPMPSRRASSSRVPGSTTHSRRSPLTINSMICFIAGPPL